MANPRFRDHIPLMIGGSGEKKTIPLAARHFDHLNIIARVRRAAAQGAGGQGRAARRSAAIPRRLETSMLVMALIDEKRHAAISIPDDFKQRGRRSADRIRSPSRSRPKVLDAGIDGVILSPSTSIDGYHPGGITAVAETVEADHRGA